MAQRRMFALTIISSDAFLDMPTSAQNLYFHLGMRADDDGFINNVKAIMRQVGCKEDDLKLLIAKKFVLLLEEGIIVIKHWNINNYIQKDRYTPTKYKELKDRLFLDKNKSYSFHNQEEITNNNTDVSIVDTQDRLGKDSIGKNIINNKEIKKEKLQYIQHDPNLNYVKITLEQYEKLKKDYPNIDIDYKIDRLEDYVACSKNKNKYKDWNRVLRRAIRENWFTNQQQNYNSQKHIAPVPDWYEKYLHDLDHNEEMKNAKPSKEAQELADSLFNDAQKNHDEPVDPKLEKLAKDIFND